MAHTRSRRDGRRDRADVRLDALHGRLDLYRLENDSVATLTLRPRVPHARIVLRRVDDLVTRLEIDAEDHRLVRFGCVARDRHLFRIASKILGETHPNRFDARLEHAPHVLDGQLVREFEISNHLLEHVCRRGTAAAVVQIDHRAIEVERTLDLTPVVLIRGDAGGGARAGNTGRLPQAADGAGIENGQCESGVEHGANEGAAIGHGSHGWGVMRGGGSRGESRGT